MLLMVMGMVMVVDDDIYWTGIGGVDGSGGVGADGVGPCVSGGGGVACGSGGGGGGGGGGLSWDGAIGDGGVAGSTAQH